MNIGEAFREEVGENKAIGVMRKDHKRLSEYTLTTGNFIVKVLRWLSHSRINYS